MLKQQNYLKVAVAAAKQAGKIFNRYFGRAKNIRLKDNDFRNVVTEADKGIETHLRAAIAKYFPKHKIIGEEFGQPKIQKRDLVWIIDPIDGTTNYIQGLPLCCISLALWDQDGPLVSVIYNPSLKQIFTAQRGKGAWLNGKRIHVSKEKNLNRALGGVGWIKVENGIKLFTILARVCRKLRILASSALQICLVGAGNYDFYVTGHIKIWDFAAAILVATEAGGKVTDVMGNKITLRTTKILASNGKIHQEILNKIKNRI